MTATIGGVHRQARPWDRRHGRAGDEGAAGAVWLLLIAGVVVLTGGLVVDGGRAIAARQQATGLAAEAARVAVDRLDTAGYRTTGDVLAVAAGSAQAAACSWVTAARPGAGCAAQVTAGGGVQVTVTIRYAPVVLAAAGVGPLHASGHATARPAVGVTGEVRP